MKKLDDRLVTNPQDRMSTPRCPQTVEQLVEVPTVLSLSSLQQLIVEQIVDIPAPGRAGGSGVEVFKVSLDRIQQRLLEQIVLKFPVEVFKALAQDRVQHLLQVILVRLGKGFFALLPEGKKCGVRSALGVGTEVRTIIHPR